MGFAAFNPSYGALFVEPRSEPIMRWRCINMRQRVGWVERSETHRLCSLPRMMGFAALNPSCGAYVCLIAENRVTVIRCFSVHVRWPLSDSNEKENGPKMPGGKVLYSFLLGVRVWRVTLAYGSRNFLTTWRAMRAALGVVRARTYKRASQMPYLPTSPDVRYRGESVAKLGHWAVDHPSWAIIESTRAVS
jgi:hypothetical protein